MREKGKLRLFENRVLRRIFGPTRDEETGGWRKILNGELNNLYYSPNIIRGIKIEKNEIGGTCSTYGCKERCVQSFGGETRRKEITWKT
jgi:hypothetical protein